LIAGNVRFQAVPKLTSKADMRRKADVQQWNRERHSWVIGVHPATASKRPLRERKRHFARTKRQIFAARTLLPISSELGCVAT
jgi:hypothetical protein